MASTSLCAWFFLIHARILLKGQYLPEVVNCNGFAREWGACPGLPSCFAPVHCKFADWEDWYYEGGCTGVCFRKRQVQEYSNENGKGCNGATGSTKDCTDEATYQASCYNGRSQGLHLYGDSSCKWQDWSAWSGCDRLCDGGEKTRGRQIAKVPNFGGAPCSPENTEEIAPCNTQPCMKCTDGRWGDWQEWHACSVSCGSGLQWRERREEVKANGCGRPSIGSSREFRPCHGDLDEDPRCPIEATQRRCMLGTWQDWAPCEAQCDIGRRSRQRPFMLGDVRHYETDLEQQVFNLQLGNDHLEEQKDNMLLNISALQREITRLKGAAGNMEKSLRRSSLSVERLRANLTHANFIRTGLEREIARLKKARSQPMGTSPPSLPARPTETVHEDNSEQVGAFTGLALLVFVAALGITCACVGCGCAKMLRRRPRTHHYDDRPEHPGTSEEDIASKDGETQPWRPLRLDEAQSAAEANHPAE